MRIAAAVVVFSLGCGQVVSTATQGSPDASAPDSAGEADTHGDADAHGEASTVDGATCTLGLADAASPGSPRDGGIARALAQLRADAGCPGMDSGAPDGAAFARVPLNHRAVAAACPMQRGPGDTGGVTPSDCSVDSDCTMGCTGRCTASCGPPGCLGTTCSYDQCYSDSDCAGGGPCLCRSSATSSDGNVCLTESECGVDSDCGPGGFCSPNAYPWWCGGTQYYCHTSCDSCLDDSDCPSPMGCYFTAGFWTCSTGCKTPPPP